MLCVKCPKCSAEYTHHRKVDVYFRDSEDSETGVHSTSIRGEKGMKPTSISSHGLNQKDNPSGRRNGISIEIECEWCNKKSTFSIFQHKGKTLIDDVEVFEETSWR